MISASLMLVALSGLDQKSQYNYCQSEVPAADEFRMVPNDIKEAHPGFEVETNEPVLLIQFTKTGNRRLIKFQKGKLGRVATLCFAGRVISQPVIQEYITGAELQISGSLSFEEANSLAITLRSGRSTR